MWHYGKWYIFRDNIPVVSTVEVVDTGEDCVNGDVVVVDGGWVVGTDVVDGGQFIVVVGAPVVDVPEVLDTSVTTVVNGVIVG